LVARVSQSLISSPFLIKIKHPGKEGIFDLWVKGRNDFQMYKKKSPETLFYNIEGGWGQKILN
jgi:hypothetical protein